MYIRFESLARDETHIETFLIEVLQDILLAQKDGISASEYFGKEPKLIADDFLKNEPTNLWGFFKIFAIVMVSYGGSSMYPALTRAGTALDFGMLLMGSVYTLIMIAILFKYSGRSIYTVSSWQRNKKLGNVLLIVICMLLACPSLFIIMFVKTSFQISLDGIAGIAVIVVSWMIGAIFYIREKDKKIWTPFVFAALAFGGLGIANRIRGLSSLVDVHSSSGKLLYIVLMIFIIVIFYIMLFVAIKHRNKTDK